MAEEVLSICEELCVVLAKVLEGGRFQRVGAVCWKERLRDLLITNCCDEVVMER